MEEQEIISSSSSSEEEKKSKSKPKLKKIIHTSHSTTKIIFEKVPPLPISEINKKATRARSSSFASDNTTLKSGNRSDRALSRRVTITERGYQDISRSNSANSPLISPLASPLTSPSSTRSTSPHSSPRSARRTVTQKMKELKMKFTQTTMKRSKSEGIIANNNYKVASIEASKLDRHNSVANASLVHHSNHQLEKENNYGQSIPQSHVIDLFPNNQLFQPHFQISPKEISSDVESESEFFSDYTNDFDNEKPAYLCEPKEKIYSYEMINEIIQTNPKSRRIFFTQQEWNSFRFWVETILKLQIDVKERPLLLPSTRMIIFLHFFRLEIPVSEIVPKNIKTTSDWKQEKRLISTNVSFIQVPLNATNSYLWWCEGETSMNDKYGLCLICHRFQTNSTLEEPKIEFTKLKKEFQTMVLNNESISSILSSSPDIQSFYIKQLVKWAISLRRQNNSTYYQLRLNSCKVLAYLTFPVESIAGLRKKLLRNGVIVSIITYAKKGELILSPEIDMNDLHFDGILDSGAVGKVYMGSWKNESVAIKVCKRENVAFIKEDFYFEVALMSVIHHPHILPCLGAKLDRDSKFFVLISPLQEKGSLKTILRNENEEISDYRKVWIAYCIADAVLHLHKNHIMHRDIKSSNILVGNNWESIYLTDFGTSRFFPKYDPTPLEGFIGTNEWMAPEILENENIDYNYKVDVYSFAILLFEIITRTIPFEGVKSWQVCPIVKEGGRPVPLSQYKVLNNLNSSFNNSIINNNNNSPGNSPRGEVQTLSYLSNLDINIMDPFIKCTPKELVTLMKECWHPSPRKRPKFSYIKNKLGILLKKVGKQPNAVIQPDTHTIKYRTDNESDFPKFNNERRRARKNSLPKLPTNFIEYNFTNLEANRIKKTNSNDLCYNSDTYFSGGYNSTSNNNTSGGSNNNIIMIKSKSNSNSPRDDLPAVVDEEDENTLNDLDEQDNDD